MIIFIRLFLGCFIQLFPFSLLCIYPFQGRCRYPDHRCLRFLILGIFVLSCIFSGICVMMHSFHLVSPEREYLTSNVLFMLLLIPCLFLYIHLTFGIPEMKLFVFLFAVTAAFVMTSLCNLVFVHIPDPHKSDHLPYSYGFLPIFLASSLLCPPPLILLLKKKFIPTSSFLGKREYRQLCFLALILFVILLVGFVPLFDNDRYSICMLCLYLGLILCAFLIYYIFFQIFALEMKRFESDRLLEHSRQQMETQNEYYKNIIEKTEENRRLRHDFRRHLIVIQGFAAEQNYNKLTEYLADHLKHLDTLAIPQYSNHMIINILLHHYHRICREESIEFVTAIPVLPELSISDTDLSALLGNLLENALNGARHAISGHKYIHVHMRVQGNQFVITVDNSFDGVVEEVRDTYLSTKKDHTGYGLLSVRQICKKYDGTGTFSHEGTVFHASAVITIS